MKKIDTELIPIKKSHLALYDNFDLYTVSKDGEPVLYKNAGKKIDNEVLRNKQISEFHIHRKDESVVVKNLISGLNRKLFEDISRQGLTTIKNSISQIVDEVFQCPLESSLEGLPDTIEIIFNQSKGFPELLTSLTSIKSNSKMVIDHSVNVFALTMQYGFFKKQSDEQIKNLGLCALLHDIGTTHIDNIVIESKERLSDADFLIWKSHTVNGYEDLKAIPKFDKSVANTALEHHELLDGSGYPKGIKDISYESEVIGIIDSYEPLKYQEKTFRASLKPFDALSIIKEDVLKGKYNRQIFVDICSCLTH